MKNRVLLALLVVAACGRGSSGDPAPSPTTSPESPSPSCNLGEERCGSTCTNPQTDVFSCGACGHPCDPGQLCRDGACVAPPTACNPGRTLCTSICVDLDTDSSNCGTCGKACSGGETCQGGVCTAQPSYCNPGLTTCGSPSSMCVDLSSDWKNCGACGNVCGDATICVNGRCTSSCAVPGQSLCPPAASDLGPYCTNLATDNWNCATCGTRCSSDQVCDRGGCVTPQPQICSPGQTWCGTRSIYDDRPPGCYDLMATWDACGSCDAFPCPQGAWEGGSNHQPGRCDQGVCARTPPTCSEPGLTWCSASVKYRPRREPNGACVDLQSDVESCGACDNWCFSQSSGLGACVAGTCVWN